MQDEGYWLFYFWKRRSNEYSHTLIDPHLLLFPIAFYNNTTLIGKIARTFAA
jgi:hypothetical protein